MNARGRLTLGAGQAYSDPVFLDFAAHPATLDFDGVLDTETLRFDAGSFALDHAGVMRAGGAASVDFAGETLLTEARIHLESLALAAALPAYAQPFLVNTAFRDVAGGGTVRGDVEIAAGLPTQAVLELEGVSFGSDTAAVSLEGLRGALRWYDDASRTALAGTIDDALFESRLAWDSGRLWGLELGPADLPFATTGRHFRLLGPATLPVFDGGSRDRHAARAACRDRGDVRALRCGDRADQRRAALARLRLAGIPGHARGQHPGPAAPPGRGHARRQPRGACLRRSRGRCSELSLRDPLGKYPRLFASIGIENLDLELVTRTFEFGMITGRLSGYISDLETFDWMPEAFDAFLFTPPEDRSKQRISQRAVTNLSSIGGGSGGGVAAACRADCCGSSTTFGYDRLGLSCRLANDVCIMGGVLPRPAAATTSSRARACRAST